MTQLAQERKERGRDPLAVEIHRVAFFLEPGYCSMPDDWSETHTQRMVRKFGSQAAFDRVKVQHRLMPRAAEAGLDAEGWSDYNLDRRTQSSTMRAHRLVAWIDRTHGWELAETAYKALHKAHFVEGEKLNDPAILEAAAAAAGIDAASAPAFLQGNDMEREIIVQTEAVSRAGIHSIPTLFVDGSPACSGAARNDEVLAVLRRASERPTGRRAFPIAGR